MITVSRTTRSLAAIGAVGAITVGAAACGGSSTADTAASTPAAAATAATTAPTPAEANTTVAATLAGTSPFSLELGSTTIPAGKVTFDVVNKGTMVHELVVLKTTTPGKDLKVTNGVADTTGSVGETGDMAAGAKTTLSVTLTPGHYVVLCNLPGHSQGGMWKDITVS